MNWRVYHYAIGYNGLDEIFMSSPKTQAQAEARRDEMKKKHPELIVWADIDEELNYVAV